jgi:glycosyltransferase involved in cell wall biosynthesis
MPVFDEAKTVAEIVNAVLDLDLAEAEIELVIVESNSRDGSREIVQLYSDHPRVTVVLQDEPRGKGAAVREGLRHVRGGVILIQDADLEYTVDDYPVLIGPIMSGDADFVLGCRHVPGKPMRIMPEEKITGWIVNAAHWMFTEFFNVVYGARLRDPFTMFKVFRAECIDGVQFVSDRFDFDWELVGKLIRLGYQPLEVPIRYEARQFHEGKKVRFFRDPPSWVVACARFRVARLPRQDHLRSAPDQGSTNDSDVSEAK